MSNGWGALSCFPNAHYLPPVNAPVLALISREDVFQYDYFCIVGGF